MNGVWQGRLSANWSILIKGAPCQDESPGWRRSVRCRGQERNKAARQRGEGAEGQAEKRKELGKKHANHFFSACTSHASCNGPYIYTPSPLCSYCLALWLLSTSIINSSNLHIWIRETVFRRLSARLKLRQGSFPEYLTLARVFIFFPLNCLSYFFLSLLFRFSWLICLCSKFLPVYSQGADAL